MLRVGMIGWRGMVGSVLMQRMREEKDFSGIEPVFFSTSNAGGAAPAEAGDGGALKDASDLRELAALRGADQLPGRRIHDGSLRAAAQKRLERLLDRCGFDAAHERRSRDHSRSGERGTDPRGSGQGSSSVRRRKLHGEPDAHGRVRTFPRGPGRVDDHDDVSGGFRERARRRCWNW